MHRIIIVAGAAGLTLIACAGGAYARYCAGPASNFSAYYYQSPGGVPPARSVRTSTGSGAGAAAVPHAQSCGTGRVWKDDRCVPE